jgi:hypothetical protein
MTPSKAHRPSKKKKAPKKRRNGGKAADVLVASGPVMPDEQRVVDGFPELPALVHYVRQRRCALFVGAGLSVGAGLPTWNDLMLELIPSATPFAAGEKALEQLEKTLAAKEAAEPGVLNPFSQDEVRRLFAKALGPAVQKALVDSDRAAAVDILYGDAYRRALARVRRDTTIFIELRKLLEAKKFPELAGYCRDLLGRRKFHALVRQELKLTGDVPDTHRHIVRTPFSCLVTTNFDSLLEDAYGRWDPRGRPKTPTGAELAQQGTLLFDGTFFILKAHGDLDDESSIIFTSEDYRRVIHSNPAFQSMLTGILLRHAVLFVGYSLSDPNFRLLLDNQLTIFNEQVPPRYALMEGVGEAEREILWRTAKLRVFSYDKGKHETVGRFLHTLADRAEIPASGHSQESAPPRSVVRKTRAWPTPGYTYRLAIGGIGDRIVMHLDEEPVTESPRRLWSGGAQWPDLPVLGQSLRDVTSNFVKLSSVTAVGALFERAMPVELLRKLSETRPEVPITLALSPQTETLPWEWLIVDGGPLCLRNPVIRRPTSVSDKARGLRRAGTPLRALLIGDAGVGNKSDYGRLPGAAREATSVAKLIRDAGGHVTSLEREDAVYARLVTEVQDGDYDIIHFAGHAWFEQSEALLYLWDGRVSSSELASILNQRPPSLLFLNSHYTAFAPWGFARAEHDDAASAPGVDRPLPPPLGMMGLSSHSGVGAFVGCFSGAVSDETACQFATTFYGELLGGRRFSEAMHRARQVTTNFDDTTGLFYAGSGNPDVTLEGEKKVR